ncbi:MAG: UTP--glucose-1-phosphate uridylyltransferase [Chloroflexi bacterium]|nr:MAG: UTP--glucose-1-phosphate uridylyltransferase [Chloroflexota bacterium]
MTDINIAVVPVAGLGSRLLPATKSQPKEMLPVGRKPVVQYVVEELANVGLKQMLFITGPGKTSIENHFDLNNELTQTLRESGKEELLNELAFERASVRYFYTRQRQLLGLGHAVLCAKDFVGNQPFIVALGDSIIGINAESNVVQRMKEQFITQDAAAVIAFEEVPPTEVFRYGIAVPREDGDIFELADVVEKPPVDEAPSNLAIPARYIFSPVIFNALEQTGFGAGNEIQLTDAIRRLIREGHKVYGVRLQPHEKRYDIGNFGSYFRAFVEFALTDKSFGADLRQHLEALLDADHT